MEGLLPILQTIHPKIEAVYSEDPQRKEKVQHMREKKIPLLLTTTIIRTRSDIPESRCGSSWGRGPNFYRKRARPNCRTCRQKTEYPSGNITFFHYGKTDAMIKARNQILKMNKKQRRKDWWTNE